MSGDLDRDVSVVVWGVWPDSEDQRQEQLRDHWPQANECLAVRRRDADGAGRWAAQTGTESFRRTVRVKFQEVFATLYRNAGIDVENVRIFDQAGVPQYLVEQGNAPMRELI